MSATDHPTQQSDDSPLFIEQIEIGPMQNFTYVIGSNTTREVALVDPAWNVDELLKHVEEQGYTPVAALITHYHPDHCGGSMRRQQIDGVAELIAQRDLKVYIHKEEAKGLKRVTGLSDSDMVKVSSGDRLDIGEIDVEFLHTPGHTPGSQCFRIRNTLVSGDTLFVQGCGRVDLPGSNPDQMYESLKQLASLPDDTVLLPGHNYSHVPRATMGETKASNGYLTVPSLEAWQQM
ncbi:MAG: MBL fold metallo-hydrolase, partial [Gammaproteobacteria bacterium]|nr:MBL fold metallo-hydrolase [Gammaproteobacteria bacterium]